MDATAQYFRAGKCLRPVGNGGEEGVGFVGFNKLKGWIGSGRGVPPWVVKVGRDDRRRWRGWRRW